MWEWHDTTWMWIAMILFWSALLAATYFLVRASLDGSHRRGPPAAAGGSAMLAERFARGEITEEEFRARHRALTEVASGEAGSNPPADRARSGDG